MWFLIRCFAVTYIFGCLNPQAFADDREVWLSGDDPASHAATDYMDLFQQHAPWERAARGLQVLKTSTQFLMRGSDEQLKIMFADLKRRNIGLGVEALMLTATSACGQGVEGYEGHDTMEKVASRVKRLGGELRYVAMDEPLDQGHFSKLSNACGSSMAYLADDIAGKVHAIRRIFPDVLIGDIETVGGLDRSDEVEALMMWSKTYEAAVGEPLSFVHADVRWDGPWQSRIKALALRLRSAGIKFGIIYNGSLEDQTGLTWTTRAEQRFAMIEADPGLVPDQAILQTWDPVPTRLLPETEPGTMTWLVNRYLALQSRFVLHRTDDRVEGRLTDNTDKPLAGVPIELSVAVHSEPDILVTHILSGTVPTKAMGAIFILRINAECNCSGTADVSIGKVLYHDDRTGQTVENAFGRASSSYRTTGSTRFQAARGEAVKLNMQSFPVNADDPFTIQVPLGTDANSASSGYVGLIFLNAAGKEFRRLRLSFDAVKRPITTVTTDLDGRFSLRLSPDNIYSSAGIRADFRGTLGHRTVSAALSP